MKVGLLNNVYNEDSSQHLVNSHNVTRAQSELMMATSQPHHPSQSNHIDMYNYMVEYKLPEPDMHEVQMQREREENYIR